MNQQTTRTKAKSLADSELELQIAQMQENERKSHEELEAKYIEGYELGYSDGVLSGVRDMVKELESDRS